MYAQKKGLSRKGKDGRREIRSNGTNKQTKTPKNKTKNPPLWNFMNTVNPQI